MSARPGLGPGGIRALVASALFVCASLIGCVSLISCVSLARAQSEAVLLLVPQTPDPSLVELFHRVEAELRLHGFTPEVLVASPEDPSESLLGAQASAERAFAAIAIVEQAPFAMLHVWIVDGRTGLTREYRVEQQGGQEPVNVVAVRVVDLLRANRDARAGAQAAEKPSSERNDDDGARSTTTGSKDERRATQTKNERPRQATAPKDERPTPTSEDRQQRPAGTNDEDRDANDSEADQNDDVQNDDNAARKVAPAFVGFQVAVEVTGLSLSRRLSWSFGPALGAWLTLADRWRIGVVGVAPLWGAVLHADLGDPTVWQELVWLELGARLLRAGPLQLSAAAGGGLHWLQAKGRRVPMPFRSVNASTWSWTGSLAARADVMLTEHWSLGFSLRARIFLPPVEVAVGSASARLATPALEGALGLSLWL